ncbi:unnamed protein product, partial [Prorocentrum cordatum]
MTFVAQVGLSWATNLVDRAFPSISALAASAETCYLLEGLGGVKSLGLSVFGLGGVLGWLIRCVLTDCDAAEYEDICGEPPPALAAAEGRLKYCLNPDGDVYPRALKCPPLHSLTGFDETGQELVVCREGQLRDGVRRMPSLYGSNWFPSIREYQDAMEFCVDPPGPNRRLVGKQALGDSAAGPTASRGMSQGTGQLSDPGANVWMCIEAPSSGGKGMPLASDQADEWVAMGKVVMFKRGTEVLVAKQVPAGEASEGPDARTLSVVLSHEGERRREFAAAVRGMTETTWAFWPLRGPRTVLWCLRFILQQDHSPKARHARWKHECNLSISDVGVSDHELCMRLFEIGSSYDQLNLPGLAIMEYVARRAQMAEWRYRDRILGRGDGDELLEMNFCISALPRPDHVSEQLHKEMMATKERRKLLEERALTGGAAGNADGRPLQQKVSNQSAEIKRLMDKLKAAAVDSWTSEALRALNSLYSRPWCEAPEGQSAAQAAGVQHLRDSIVLAGPPPFSAAAAHRELRRNLPGYSESEPVARYQKEKLSLPSSAPLRDLTPVLEGGAHHYWVDWDSRILRRDPTGIAKIRLYVDETLRGDPSQYAEFIILLFEKSLVNLTTPASATVGLFFVRKANGDCRVIFDARQVNQYFEAPEYVQLPTGSAWARTSMDVDKGLQVCQMDAESAFYRILAPRGLEEWCRLPRVDLREVRRLRPELAPSDLKGAYATPQLLALAMGFSWSLYFCREAVGARARAASAPRRDFARGRHGGPELESGPKVAACVDGVAVVSQDRHAAVDLGKKRLASLEEGGLRCKGLEEPARGVKFTGLVFDQKAGAIRVPCERMWRVRLAFLHVCDRGWASGGELMVLAGHFTWAALLRRPLMSILPSVYKFSEWAG